MGGHAARLSTDAAEQAQRQPVATLDSSTNEPT
jgi:hypothetical protein